MENHTMKPTQLAEMHRLSQLHKQKLDEIARRQRGIGVPTAGGLDLTLPKILEHSRRTRLEQGGYTVFDIGNILMSNRAL